jgi:hypothetical protein
MANENKDILRYENTEALLPGMLRNKMIGFETNNDQRMVRKDVSGNLLHWTPDENYDIGASGVDYDSVQYPNVQAALDYLLYEAPVITSFTHDAIAEDKGSTVTGLQFTWAISDTQDNLTALYLVGSGMSGAGVTGVLGVDDTSYHLTGIELTSDTPYTLYLDTELEVSADSDTEYVRFKLNKYYGTSSNGEGAITEADIEGAGTAVLSTDAASSRTLSSVTITGGGDYVIYAYPSAWGTINLTVNGFASTWDTGLVSVSNADGNTENYRYYVSPYTIVGDVTLVASA